MTISPAILEYPLERWGTSFHCLATTACVSFRHPIARHSQNAVNPVTLDQVLSSGNMQSAIRILLPSISIILIATGPATGTPINNTSLDAAASLSTPLNDFAISLFDRLSRENHQSNVLVSPFSVSTALSMLMLGSRATSAQQLRQVLRLEETNDTEVDTIHQLLHEVSC